MNKFIPVMVPIILNEQPFAHILPENLTQDYQSVGVEAYREGVFQHGQGLVIYSAEGDQRQATR